MFKNRQEYNRLKHVSTEYYKLVERLNSESTNNAIATHIDDKLIKEHNDLVAHYIHLKGKFDKLRNDYDTGLREYNQLRDKYRKQVEVNNSLRARLGISDNMNMVNCLIAGIGVEPM